MRDDDVHLENVENIPLLKGQIQSLVDNTLTGWGWYGRRTRTQDRQQLVKKGVSESLARVPAKLTVELIQQVENAANFLNYKEKKNKLREARRGGWPEGWTDKKYVGPQGPVAKAQTAIYTINEALDEEVNEVYLFHGCTPFAAGKIAEENFDLAMVGKSTGTLFGRGVYFAESSLKADEYSTNKPDEELFPVLLARVLLGKPKLCQDRRPDIDPEALQKCCEEQDGVPPEFDSIIGDREPEVGTFREFIVFDNSQVYPEFIVWYRKSGYA